MKVISDTKTTRFDEDVPGTQGAGSGSDTRSNSEVLSDLEEKIGDIQTRLEHLESMMIAAQEQLSDLLWQTREQLLRRSDEIQATIYELEAGLAESVHPAAAVSQGRADGEASFSPKPPGYAQLIDRIRNLVSATVRSGSTVIVTSRGDEQLLEFDNAQGWHFPQTDRETYAGYHPRDSEEAIQHLEELRSRGGDYLLIPATAAWWLDFYREFRDHLERHYSVVVREPDTCVLYRLFGNRPKLRRRVKRRA
ncbi:MAG: hypothetical protein ACREX3_15355 [Gammaproteobacteria bacterium]